MGGGTEQAEGFPILCHSGTRLLYLCFQKRVKAAESESKLKQVYIPSYNKPNPNLLSGKLTEAQMGGRPCEGCSKENADGWYAWGPVQLQCRLCKYRNTIDGCHNTIIPSYYSPLVLSYM